MKKRSKTEKELARAWFMAGQLASIAGEHRTNVVSAARAFEGAWRAVEDGDARPN